MLDRCLFSASRIPQDEKPGSVFFLTVLAVGFHIHSSRSFSPSSSFTRLGPPRQSSPCTEVRAFASSPLLTRGTRPSAYDTSPPFYDLCPSHTLDHYSPTRRSFDLIFFFLFQQSLTTAFFRSYALFPPPLSAIIEPKNTPPLSKPPPLQKLERGSLTTRSSPFLFFRSISSRVWTAR